MSENGWEAADIANLYLDPFAFNSLQLDVGKV